MANPEMIMNGPIKLSSACGQPWPNAPMHTRYVLLERIYAQMNNEYHFINENDIFFTICIRFMDQILIETTPSFFIGVSTLTFMISKNEL